MAARGRHRRKLLVGARGVPDEAGVRVQARCPAPAAKLRWRLLRVSPRHRGEGRREVVGGRVDRLLGTRNQTCDPPLRPRSRSARRAPRTGVHRATWRSRHRGRNPSRTSLLRRSAWASAWPSRPCSWSWPVC